MLLLPDHLLRRLHCLHFLCDRCFLLSHLFSLTLLFRHFLRYRLPTILTHTRSRTVDEVADAFSKVRYGQVVVLFAAFAHILIEELIAFVVHNEVIILIVEVDLVQINRATHRIRPLLRGTHGTLLAASQRFPLRSICEWS